MVCTFGCDDKFLRLRDEFSDWPLRKLLACRYSLLFRADWSSMPMMGLDITNLDWVFTIWPLRGCSMFSTFCCLRLLLWFLLAYI